MNVTTVNLLEADDWDSYVRAHPDATFFHLAGWGRVVEKTFGHRSYYLCARNDAGAIAGILPLVHVRSRLFGNGLTSNGFAVYGGPVADSAAAHDALDDAAWSLAQELGAQHLEYRSPRRQRPDWACREDMYVTFRRAIDPDPEANLKAIPRKQRAVVRKAIKRELQTEVSRDVDTFFRMYSASVRNLGTPVFARGWFANLMDEFGDAAEILTVRNDGEALTSVLSFYFRDEVLPYYGGGVAGARNFGANDFMYWALMEHARERGCTLFDYGRSKVGTGAWSFKKNWGFEPEPLYYEFRLADGAQLPDINPLNPKYRLFIAAWKKLPQWAANIVGPMISRGLG